MESGADYYRLEVHGPALLAACEVVNGLSVLDLGCAQGYFTRELAKQKAKVIGIDLSERQIDFVRTHEEDTPLGIEYKVMSAREVNQYWPETFDLITACMAIGDMAEIEATLRSARDVLRPQGRMVFSEAHPCTDTAFREWEVDEKGGRRALKIDRYFESAPFVCHWNMQRLKYRWDTPGWRLTLTEWSRFIAGSGFAIRRLLEPRPTREQVGRNPDLEDRYRLPYFLIFDLQKLP